MLKKLISHLQLSFSTIDSVIFGGTAILVGLGTGGGVWVFKRLIDLVNRWFFTDLSGFLQPLGQWRVVILPVIGGLLVGLIISKFTGSEQSHGVAGVMESVALAGGRLRYQHTPVKVIAAAVSIGSGASVGPEDPSVQIGANLGSMFGQWFHLSEDQVRTLVAAGAAAGIAAAFNAPIAGVFFALEIVLGEIGSSALGMVVISAVTSAVLTQAIAGNQPAFQISAYSMNSAWELPLYLLLGIMAGPISAIYVKLLYTAQDLFQKIHAPAWMKAVIAGLIVGILGMAYPQVFGVGYSTIEKILGGTTFPIGLLLMLLAAKIIATPVSISGGFVGGVFAPALFLGATFGAAFGQVAELIFPSLNIHPAAFAMVSMAAVLAGSVHAPLTAILLLFEMTNDYRIILPLMFSVIISWQFSKQLQPDSAYTLGLLRKGIRLEHGRDIDVLDRIDVAEIMEKNPFTFNADTNLKDAADFLYKTRHHGAPVVDNENHLLGVFTIEDLDGCDPDKWKDLTVGELCTKDPMVAYPDESIGEALRRMGRKDVGRLPVVRKDNPRDLVGLIRRNDLVRAYDTALTRRATLRHQAEQVYLDASTPEAVAVRDVKIEPGSVCDGKNMKDIPWPKDCIVASVRRGRRVLIPKGDTVIKGGDTLVVVGEESITEQLNELCTEKV